LTSGVSERQACFAHCEDLLRTYDRTAWLASLFAPEQTRGYIHALHAFFHEIGRVRSIVSEPSLGEIRLQWWTEVVRGGRAGEAAANPISAALMATIADCSLPVAAFTNMLEARRFDLYNDPMPSLNDLEGHCGEVYGALLRLASIALCSGQEPGAGEACGHAGIALGLAAILRDLPQQAARGQCFVPLDLLSRHGALPQAVSGGVMSEPLLQALAELRALARRHLEAARRGLTDIDVRARPAFVLLSQVEPLLRRMERRGYDPFTSDVSLPQWRSQWVMWRWR
jgi:phytoene synthase